MLKYYDSALSGKWRASVGLYGMPKTARGTDVAVHKSSKYPHMNVISGMAGTPSCGAWVCKCAGGLIEVSEIQTLTLKMLMMVLLLPKAVLGGNGEGSYGNRLLYGSTT